MSTAVAAQLSAAVDALSGVDVDGLDDDTLHTLTVATQRLQDRLDVAAGRLLARWDARGVWRNDQSLSPKARLAREIHCADSTAGRRLRRARARALGRVPGVAAAVAEGGLSMDHVELLARAQSRNPAAYTDAEAMLVGECIKLRYQPATQVVDYWLLHADPDGTPPADPTDASAYAAESDDGTVHVSAMLTGLAAHHYLTELDRLANQIRLADERNGIVRSVGQRRAAAMLEMAIRSASTPAGAQRPKPLFTVLLGDNSFTGLCETSTGRVISPDQLAPYVDDAVMETIYFAGPVTIIGRSNKRSFTGALRRAIEVRDRHCQHPAGCDIPAERCDVDHIVPVIDGGVTDQHNGRLQCPGHNRHPDRHDPDPQPLPEQSPTYLDYLRTYLRWHYRPDYPDDDQLAG